MFIKSLRIENKYGLIRLINFKSGLNLIVDETPVDQGKVTGNNVGKTTVLMLIDFCLGEDPRKIYSDPENRKNENLIVKDFLVKTEVLVALTLTSDLQNLFAEELVIERNFLPRSKHVRRINGEQKTEDEFFEFLTNQLFPGHYGSKPTFNQIISHNIRYKDLSLINTLKTLNQYTTREEYETLYLFLFGCKFDSGARKQEIVSRIRVETNFKSRLEARQSRSAYEASLAILLKEIEAINARRATLRINSDFESDLVRLDEIRYEINQSRSRISRIRLKKSLISEAVEDAGKSKFHADVSQLKALYQDARKYVGEVSKSFEELVLFHNQMVEERVRYIEKDLPFLSAEILQYEESLSALLREEATLSEKLSISGSLAELESVISTLNAKHQKRGEYEAIIAQIDIVEKDLRELNSELKEIDEYLFSDNFGALVRKRVNKFSEFFSGVSTELYGEQYAIKIDKVTSRAGQAVYQFSPFDINQSSGKKQGEIACFDIAYTLYADDQHIPCYHFLLNDKKELMHGNQLVKIAGLVTRESRHVQFVASILRDKLPLELNKEHNFIVKLSQERKLFDIENRS